jgi:hypothetical protein
MFYELMISRGGPSFTLSVDVSRGGPPLIVQVDDFKRWAAYLCMYYKLMISRGGLPIYVL